MSNTQRLQDLYQVIQRYFKRGREIYNNSSSIDDFDKQISEVLKDDIDRYGEILIPTGLALISLALRDTDLSKFKAPIGGDKYFMFNQQTENTINLMTAMVLAFGERGVWKLIEIMDSNEEDLGTLAVSCINEEIINRSQIISKLKSKFLEAEGTIYKLNIVLTLRMYGGDKEENFAESFLRECGIEDIIQISDMVYVAIATDGNTYMNSSYWKKNRH